MWTEKHFELTEDELDEIRRKREMKRSRKKFSELLSSEAQEAMKLARDDTLALIADTAGLGTKDDIKSEKQSTGKNAKGKKRISFADAYQNTQGFLMEGDITYRNTNDQSKFGKVGLGGTRVESTMELVENLDSETETNNGLDEIAIEETARRNSVKKCLVWMEVTENETDGGLKVKEESQNSQHGSIRG